MSRWSDAFDAIMARDTCDTCDTWKAGEAGAAHLSPSVACVSAPDAGPTAAGSIAEGDLPGPDDGDHDAPAGPVGRLPVIPLSDIVEEVAQAMIDNPVYRITNQESAMAYFRANALTRLTATNDPLTRERLLDWARNQAPRGRRLRGDA